MPLTAIVLAKNEEQNIARCLKALSFCNEVIVINDDSTDGTVQKAKEQGAIVVTRAMNGNFAAQRNAAMEQAKNPWILYIDADEVVSSELAKEITTLLETNTREHAFRIPRRDWFWGQAIEHGEVAFARKSGFIRLVKKRSGIWKGTVHEEFHPTDSHVPVGQLNNTIEHYPHPTLTEFLLDINDYSTIRAKELFDTNHRFSLLETITKPVGKFIYTYFVKQGYKDGPAGFAYSFLMSFHSFLVRAKLYQYSVSNS